MQHCEQSLFLISILFFVVANLANAQVKTNFNNSDVITEQGKFSKNYRGKRPFTIPARDIQALLDKDKLENLSEEPKPFKIAEAVKVDIDVVKEADWIEADGFSFGKFTVVATDAKSVSANFDQFYLPKGAELYLYSENGEMITGPITEAENNENNFWGTWVYKGERLTVDLKTPIESKTSLKLRISSIAYGYKELYVSDFGASANCNINVLCPAGNGWENERNSVALILDANSTSLCSGALVNNTCNLSIPYLLTANHCFDTNPQQNVAQWKFTFQAWSPTCTPSQNANGITFNGSAFRARNAASDFCLVELNQLPPGNSGITFSGWSRVSTASPSGVSITHPRGDVMKVATYNTATTQQTFLGVNSWRANWVSGTVEPTSSGGPLYDNNRRIIGQLTGGNPADVCTTNDHAFFGRFDISWTGGGTNATRLSNWLDPNNTGAMTTNTINLPSIAGPDLLCSPGSYTLQNLPAGSTATWSVIPASQFVNGSGTGSSAFMELSGNYTGIRAPRIVFTISTDCGDIQVDKTFWIGPPQVTYHPPGQNPCLANPYYSTISLPGFTYNWSVDNPNVWLTSNGQSITSVLSYNPEYFNITLEISDGNCTTSRTISSYTDGYYCQCFSDPSCGNELALKVYPNPAAEMITVELDTANVSSIERGFAQYELKLYTTSGEELFSQPVTSAKTLLDVRSLKNGFYYLHLIHKEGIIRKQIRIER